MCLVLQKRHLDCNGKILPPLVAKKDIKVYKVIRDVGEICPKYVTPCFYTKLVFNEQGIAELASQLRTYEGNDHYLPQVNAGIHAYTNKDTARRWSYSGADYSDCIAEAIIPKGAKYYRGEYDEIVADRMLIKKPSWQKISRNN